MLFLVIGTLQILR